MKKSKLQLIKDKEGGIIGHRFKCQENDNEIKFYHVDGNVEDGEFHFGHESGIDGWTVIGENDLMQCIKEMDLIEKEISLPTAIEILKEKLKDDDELAWGWHCNIAVPMQDEEIPHSLANKIASRLMKSLFEVDTNEKS